VTEADWTLDQASIAPQETPVRVERTRTVASFDFPLWLKIGATLFVCVHVAIFTKAYGARDLLWFSSIGLYGTVLAIWLRSRLLANMMLLMVFLPDGVVWSSDFAMEVISHWQPLGMKIPDGWFFGFNLAGAEYMFDTDIPLFVRSLSLYHMAVPALLVFLVIKWGYDSRAFAAQVVLGALLLCITRALTSPDENINYVFSFTDQPQTRVPGRAYLLALMAGATLCIYLPVHLVLLYWNARRSRRRLRRVPPTAQPALR
jgi:hypothetical protein